jgi:pimeloyl-ACP methyl ester carboxylesterase
MKKKIIASVLGNSLNSLAYIYPSLAGKLGFKLFCYPFRTKLRDFQLDFLNTAEKKTFFFKNNKIQTYQWGKGEKKILMLHGWQSHSFRWKSYIESLAGEEYTVYTFDAPAHGLSEGAQFTLPLYTEIILHYIESIGELHTIIGHSLGSFAALYSFEKKADLKIKQMILLAPPGEVTDFIDFYKTQLNLRKKTIHEILVYFESHITKPIDYFKSYNFAQNVKIPGLIIHDEGDLEIPHKYAVAINENWKQSKLILTKGLGHNLKSSEVVSHVIEFIKQPQISHN